MDILTDTALTINLVTYLLTHLCGETRVGQYTSKDTFNTYINIQ